MPLDLLRSEQARLTDELERVRGELLATVAGGRQLEATADQAVAWLNKCQRAYKEMTPRDRRLMNQAFFTAVWITEDGVVGWEYNEPFANLMRAHHAREPIFSAAPVSSAPSPPKAGYERRSPGHRARASLRWGLKQFNLAE